MVDGDCVLSDKQMNVLSTSLTALIDPKFRRCSVKKDGSFNIICTDDKRRRLSRAELIDLQNLLATLAGHKEVLTEKEATIIKKEVFG